MKTIVKSLALLSLVLSPLSFAGSPFAIVNNNEGQLTVGYSLCSDSKLCNYVTTQQLAARSSGQNTALIVHPFGTHEVQITSAVLVDANGNQTASLNGNCNAKIGETQQVVLDSYGSNTIYCIQMS